MNVFEPDTPEWDAFERSVARESIDVVDSVLDALRRYVAFPSDEAAWAVTLWILATHAQTVWEHAPRLAVISPEKRCGKSRLMDIVETLAYRPVITVNISPAALVRSIAHDDPPTLLIDEADTIFGNKAGDHHEDLRGIINSGHQRNRPYIRYDITTRKNESMPTFCMAMLAGIGDLPDTIMDRAVVIRMRRRAPDEQVHPYRTRRDRPELDRLAGCIGQLVQTILKGLKDHEPRMPVEDRAADTWEPLVSMADVVGGDWPKRARQAVLALVGAEDETDVEQSLGRRLLSDVQETFASLPGVGFLPSTELVNRLRKLDDSPWGDFDLTARKLAYRLGQYGIRPGHNEAKTVRGYQLSSFYDAFNRYLHVPTRPEASKRPEVPLSPGQDTDASSRKIRPEIRPEPGPDAWTDADTSQEESMTPDPPCPRCGSPLASRQSADRNLCWKCHTDDLVRENQP